MKITDIITGLQYIYYTSESNYKCVVLEKRTNTCEIFVLEPIPNTPRTPLKTGDRKFVPVQKIRRRFTYTPYAKREQGKKSYQIEYIPHEVTCTLLGLLRTNDNPAYLVRLHDPANLRQDIIIEASQPDEDSEMATITLHETIPRQTFAPESKLVEITCESVSLYSNDQNSYYEYKLEIYSRPATFIDCRIQKTIN